MRHEVKETPNFRARPSGNDLQSLIRRIEYLESKILDQVEKKRGRPFKEDEEKKELGSE